MARFPGIAVEEAKPRFAGEIFEPESDVADPSLLDQLIAGGHEMFARSDTGTMFEISKAYQAHKRGEDYYGPRENYSVSSMLKDTQGKEDPGKSLKKLQTFIDSRAEHMAKAEAVPYSKATQKFMDENSENSVWEDFAEAPVKIISELGVRSAPNMVPGLIYGSAGALVAGPWGFAAGMGAGSARVEYAASMMEGLEKEGVDLQDAGSILDAVENEELMDRIQKRALIRSAVIGGVDAVSGGLAGKTLTPLKGAVARELTNAIAQTGAQAVLGGTGEALAQVATGEELKPREIAAEAVGEMVTAPVEVAAAAVSGARAEAAKPARQQLIDELADKRAQVLDVVMDPATSVDEAIEVASAAVDQALEIGPEVIIGPDTTAEVIELEPAPTVTPQADLVTLPPIAPTVEAIHNLADEKGIPWDDDPAFMTRTEVITEGRTGRLDDLTSDERQRIFDELQAETGIERPAKTEEKLANFLDRAVRRYAMEEQGQAILDDLDDANTTPKSVSDRFWNETYFDLNAETQAKFQKYLERLGFQPGDVADNQGRVLGDWPEVGEFFSGDLPVKVEGLEGTERGYIALMEWANQQRDAAPTPETDLLEPAEPSVSLDTIRIEEDMQTEEGETVRVSRLASTVLAEVDGRIDAIKALIGCMRK